MPTTMGHLSTERAEQDALKLLIVGDWAAMQLGGYLHDTNPGDLNIVNVGGVGEDPVRYPWAKRLQAQLNTRWVPRCILFFSAFDATGAAGSLTMAEYTTGCSEVIDTANTSTARVILLPPSVDAVILSEERAMLLSLPADEFVETDPADGGEFFYWREDSTLPKNAAVVAHVIRSGA